MKAWSIKYWETCGIQEYTNCKEHGDRVINVGPRYEHIGHTVFLSREEAVEAAEKQRRNRIESLKTKLAKLEAMKFA